MEAWTTVFLFFIAVAGVILLVVITYSQRGSGSLRLGEAELKIDFERGWQWAPSQGKVASRNNQSRYWLEVKGTRWRYPLVERHPIYLGRAADNSVRLKDPMADGRQAVIYWEQERYKINNLSSRVPTLINGRRFAKQNLGDGNSIQMGRTRLIFRERKK
jgi:hypothetical protein